MVLSFPFPPRILSSALKIAIESYAARGKIEAASKELKCGLNFGVLRDSRYSKFWDSWSSGSRVRVPGSSEFGFLVLQLSAPSEFQVFEKTLKSPFKILNSSPFTPILDFEAPGTRKKDSNNSIFRSSYFGVPGIRNLRFNF